MAKYFKSAFLFFVYIQFKYVQCLGNITLVSALSTEEIEVILKKHNEFRRQVVPSGSNIRMLSWSNNLAGLAQEYANKCIFKHSGKALLEPFGYIAESIYIDNQRSNETDDMALPVVAWYNETHFYDYDSNTCASSKICGHYTQAVWDKTFKLGCGKATCNNTIKVGEREYRNSKIVVCKYGPAGNKRLLFQKKTRRPYTKGNWCSNCPKEAPVCVDRLCDIKRDAETKRSPSSNVLSVPSLSPGKRILNKTELCNQDDESLQFYQLRTYTSPGSLEACNRSGYRGSNSTGLRCFECDGECYESECVAKNKTKICGSKSTRSDKWSCIKFTQHNLIKMSCLRTDECEELAMDPDLNVKCCKRDFCNNSHRVGGHIRLFFLMVVFLNTLSIY